IFGIILGIVSTLILVINQQSENFSRIDIEEMKVNLNMLNYQIRDYLGLERIDLFERYSLTHYLEGIDFKAVPLFMSSLFGKVGAIIIGFFSVVFISFFFLTDSNILLNSFLAFSKRGSEERFKRVFTKIKKLLSRYFIV